MGTRVVFEFDLWGLLLGQWSLLWEHWLVGPGRFEWNFREMIFKLILQIDGWGIHCEITLRRMSLDLTDDKSTLVQVMTWRHQATSHYLSQCWSRSLLPYGGSRPQWVKICQRWKSDVFCLSWWRKKNHSIFPSPIIFYTPVWKTDVLCRGNVSPSVRLSVRPSVRPRFPDFSSTCFEISIWNLVYTFSRWHDISSLSCITIGSLWPSLQPKVGQTHFLQSWPHKSR